jgi:acetyltransferase-like isoleucine patch superfamily enzyme
MEFVQRIRNRLSILYYQKIAKKKFNFFGLNVLVLPPLRIDGHENISLEDNVHINYKTWLAALPLAKTSSCILQIGAGSIIGNFNHIYATQKIIIGKKVLTADKVYISDNFHGYKNIKAPIMDQPIIQNKEVSIGDGSWLGENVVVLGSKIGRNCVIGANAVVTKDIPDFCVVVGVPAVIIKRYHMEKQAWIKTNSDGSFLDEVAINSNKK